MTTTSDYIGTRLAASYPWGAEVPRETILWLPVGETVSVTGEGTVDFIHSDGTTSGVLTPPSNGAPAYITGVEGLCFRINGDLKLEAA